MKVLFTDHDMLDVSLESASSSRPASSSGSRNAAPRDVIREGKGCSAMLIQYAPINAKVFEALPEVRLCARIGAGYDTIMPAMPPAMGCGSPIRRTMAWARFPCMRSR